MWRSLIGSFMRRPASPLSESDLPPFLREVQAIDHPEAMALQLLLLTQEVASLRLQLANAGIIPLPTLTLTG